MRKAWPHVVPWILVVAIGGPIAIFVDDHLESLRVGEPIEWRHPLAFFLMLAGVLAGWVLFHLRPQRTATLAFTRVGTLAQVSRGAVAYLASLPGVLRVLALVAVAAALARPQTYRTVRKTTESVDVMVVFDLSKSMEEADMQPRRDRHDAAQYVVRQFVAQREGDRVGLAIFGQGAMLQVPLTTDMQFLDWVVADLQIGDVPESGTAIGDGLAMALGELRKSDAKSKVVVLLSDGDNNVVTAFTPEDAAQLAVDMKVRVFTVLVGSEGPGGFGFGMGVNPETLRRIADRTGGRFFRATDVRSFNESFEELRRTLDKDRRVKTERIPDQELFHVFLVIAGVLLGLELLLASTRFRRFP